MLERLLYLGFPCSMQRLKQGLRYRCFLLEEILKSRREEGEGWNRVGGEPLKMYHPSCLGGRTFPEACRIPPRIVRLGLLQLRFVSGWPCRLFNVWESLHAEGQAVCLGGILSTRGECERALNCPPQLGLGISEPSSCDTGYQRIC